MNLIKSVRLALLIVIISFISLYIAVNLQEDEYLFIKLLVIVLMFCIFYFYKKITVANSLLLLILFYIKPASYMLYTGFIIVVISFIVEQFLAKNRLIHFPYKNLILLILILSFIPVFKASILIEGIHLYFSVVFLPILIMLIIVNSDFNLSHIISFLKLLVYIATFVALFGIVIAIRMPSERIGSFWNSAMTINAFYLMTFFISIGLSMHYTNNKMKTIFVLCSIIIGLGMLFTYTRMAILALAFGLIVLSFMIVKFRKYAFFTILLIPLFIPSSFQQRLSLGIMNDPSILLRFYAWNKSIMLIKDNFLWGIGFNTWANIYQNMIPHRILYIEHPHNIILRYLLEFGFFGFVLYFSLVFSIIKKSYIRIREEVQENYILISVFVAVLSVLFACLTDVFISKLSISLLFWILLSFLIILKPSLRN